MKTRNLILLAALLMTGGSLACNPNGPNTNTQPATPSATSTPAPTVSDRRADNRCYVQIFEDENYQDSSDVIYGPGRWSNMRGLPGANKGDWGDQIDSLKVGPAATVTVWEDENFSDNSQTYDPGTEKTNLRGDPDMGDQIDSIEIKCQ